ncbi:MAG TPA: xanthine dehydrogenase family protein molybdopterin-binding subunit [Dehalococcoidales bacterium]|nr:xanthine dehydrogenase family protein molybdopterin-binding subunit [Dehalococcoidales bacterium]
MNNEELSRMLESFDNLKADKYPLENYESIGKRGVRRIDGVEKASGAARYTIDVQLPGMLHGRFLTCPYPHAEIMSMDTGRAEKLAGVRGVLRYDDPELPESASLGGHEPFPTVVLPRVAHFQGEEVGAFVVADTEDIAAEALELIEVAWQPRPFVLDPEEALKPDAPLANPEALPKGNLDPESTYIEKHGDVAKGFAEADKIIEFKFTQGLNTWVGPERPCGVFRWNGEYPEVWLKQQRPHISKRHIATWFGGIPMNKIDVHCLYQGASFGGWSQVSWNLGGHYCAALMSRRLNRPVMWTFNRREDFYGGEMDEGVYYYKVGARRDGTITAVEARAVVTNQFLPVFGVVKHFIDNTRVPNIYGKTESVMINKGPTVATRCEQNSNCHSMTLVFNRVAAALGLDPTEVALKNDGAEGHDIDWLNRRKAEMGFPVRDSLKECLDKGRAAIGWDRNWHAPGTKRLPDGRMHGLAFTWTHEWDDSGGSSEIAIYIERNDATATILGCRSDVGVNAETAYCQIAADELGLRIEDVRYKGQMDAGFYTMTPDTSTNMSVNGSAVRHCARLLKKKILETAVAPRGVTQLGSFPPAFPDKKPEELDIRDSVIFEKANPTNRLTLAEFVGPSGAMGPLLSTIGEPVWAGKEGIKYPLRLTPPLFEHAWHVQRGTYIGVRLRLCRQAHFMEVAVDTETGEVDITRMVTVNDVGKAISVEGCEGQAYGGAVMAAGRGHTEEVVHDPNTGVMLNGNLLNYKIPTLMDVGEIDTVLVETGMGYGPYGLVGIGEDVATVMPTLIGAAVHNATGKWVDGFPVTPDRVLRALGKA